MDGKSNVWVELKTAACWFNDRWIAFFIFIHAFSLRYNFRSAGLFHTDSVGYAVLGELTFKTLSMNYAHFPGHPGVVLINAAFYGFFQLFNLDSEFTTLFVSVFFGALAAPLIYLMCIELGVPRIYALYTGLLMVFFPLQWSLSEYMPTDVESLFFLLAAFYFTLKTKRSLLYLGSLLFVFSITIKLENMFLLPFYISLCILKLHSFNDDFIKSITSKEFITILLIQVLVFFIFYGSYLPVLEKEIDDPVRIALVQMDTLSWQFREALDLMLDTFSLIGIVLIIMGITGIFENNSIKYNSFKRKTLFIFLSLAIFNIIFSASIPLRDYDRYILTGFSFLIIFTAFGFILLVKINKHLPAVVIVFLLFYMINFTVPIVSDRHVFAGQKEFADNLKYLVEKEAVIVAMDSAGLINYYTNLTVIQPDLGTVEKLLLQNISVYAVSGITAYEQGRDFYANGQKQLNFTLIGSFPNEYWHGNVLKRGIVLENVIKIEI